MSELPEIDLTDLGDKWSETNQQECCSCGSPVGESAPEDSQDQTPLRLFHEKDEKTLMLTVCWTCVYKRMADGQNGTQSFAA